MIWRHFSSFVLKINFSELQWIILLGDIRKRDKTISKVTLIDQTHQQECRTILSELPACVREGWLLQTSQHNWTNEVKKMCQHPLCGKDCEAGLYGRIAVKKLLLKKQNNVRRLQWVKAHKDWKKEQWNKEFWQTNQSLKSLGQIGGSTCSE